MKSLLFLFVFICLCSCTITKRFHNPGWHVEWKYSKLKNHQTANDQDIASDNLTKTDAHSSSVSQTISLENKVGHKETTAIHAQQESSLDEVVSDQQQHQAEQVYSTNQKKQESQPEDESTDDSPKVEPLGIASIFAGSTALIFFLNICFLLSDNGWNAIFGLGYPGLFLIVFALAAIGIIMGIVSYKRIQENPDLYKGKRKGKGRALTGMYLSYVTSGLGLALLLGIGLFYLFDTFFSW
jgi:hypothetical protein